MSRRTLAFWAVAGIVLVFFGASTSARGQAMLADDIVLLSKGQRGREKARTTSHLGSAPGAGENPFRFRPGSNESRLAGHAAAGTSAYPIGVLTAATGLPQIRNDNPPRIQKPSTLVGESIPLYGAIDMADVENDGPANGLTFDTAVNLLVQRNTDLRTKFQEIPKAEADVLSAGLLANPLIFATSDANPYGSYSRQRPGQNGYQIVLVQTFDINGKRANRVIAARQAKKVLQAQYQDAVRLTIDNLATLFVNVIDARAAILFKRSNLDRLDKRIEVNRQMFREGVIPHTELDRSLIERESSQVEMEGLQVALTQAKRNLTAILNLPAGDVDAVEPRGSLGLETFPAPPVADLERMALLVRPDLVAYRLGVGRAGAELALARSERFEDVYLLYTPYNFTNYAWEGQKSATSWGLGVLVSLPILNRNQGNIERARHSIVQSRIELTGVERQVVEDVRRAALEHEAAHQAVQRLKKDVIPKASHLRDDAFKIFRNGEGNVTAYYDAERELNNVLRLYRDALIRHRRAMLRLNTAVGHRIFP